MSKFDRIYRRFILTKFFTRGWGKPENLKRIFDFRKVLSNREECCKLIPSDYPVHIDKEEIQGDIKVLEGHFVSPFTQQLPGIMPKEAEIAKFQVILPKVWKGPHKPVCLHLAGTGDHFYWRRRRIMAGPLLKENGIASIILESPYYGGRKPRTQLRSSLHYTSDLFVMGGALMLESLVLFNWCERQCFGPLGVTGISMGGFMASLAASVYPKPISLIPCLSWTTASSVFTKGVMRKSIPWKVLENQYTQDAVYDKEIKHTLISPEEVLGSSYSIGQEFVRQYSEKYEQSNKLRNSSHKTAFKRNNGSEFDDKMDIEADIAEMEEYLCKKSGKVPIDNPLIRIKNYKLLNTINQAGFGVPSSRPKSHINHHQIRDYVLDFMRGVMDECTHLGNFAVPVDTSLIIIVAAHHDAYVPRKNVIPLEHLWPGSQVRYVDTGHINAFILHNNQFRKAIMDSFDKQIQKYHS